VSDLLLRWLQHVHGHLSWLGVAALLHPAIVLRSPTRRARLSAALSAAFVAATAVTGVAIYPAYRERIRGSIFLEAPRLGWMFERKEHLAVGAVALAAAGCLAHLAVSRDGDVETRLALARLAHRAFVASFVLALLAAAMGLAVASYRSLP
jgi:hypothetical protein